MKRYGHCQCGCGEKTKLAPKTDRRYGSRKGQPVRFLKGHHLRRAVTGRDGYEVDRTSGCWLWRLKRDRAGYGYAFRNGRTFLAHRWFYELHKGPIPEGLCIDHLCRNRACVNPDHLEAVPVAINNRRGSLAKLTVEDVREIKASSSSQVELAERFGVDPSNVSHILAGRRWV